MTMIEITPEPGGSRPLRGYLATPAGEGPWPGVLLIHEAFGLDDNMRRHADRLAGAGYLTIGPDLYSQGGARKCLVSTMRAMQTGRGRAFADLEAARKWLASSDQCTGKIGAIGFCMGGGFALLTVHTHDAVSANYGFLPKNVDEVMAGACPVVGSYGGLDTPLRTAPAKLEAALTKAGVVHDVKQYPKAGHAFLNEAEGGPGWLRPLLRATHNGPNPDAAADAWRRIETFFAEHLGGGRAANS
ncbi:dienelactone hydrolase family protein [Actinophytocola oryzae]|uniref:Carboxymethylenebutenolidase n=1 Tax=Actinophytocola oryzae TaxID=502181 RepID=A0A4V6Q6V1_9PSEU|nr:dienelactone hydrolase family protein [Actinophytocola oryzae]TDV51941.1 carboxymethylenebutenolidase [Actinophytocola oryzae]